MKKNDIKTIELNNGVKMPQVGLGTFLVPEKEISRLIGKAYALGYRNFDTAWRYHNEKAIAAALKENGIRREDVFITTKVNADALYFWGFHAKKTFLNIRRRTIRGAIEDSFRNLGGGYVDLFLVHGLRPYYGEMYAALSEVYREGRIRAIGVCSSLPGHLEYLKEFSDVVPAVNQFEISPLNTQKNLIRYCKERGIAVTAMSTFSHYRSVKPRLEILENPEILDIAGKYGKSAAQVILKWLVQQGISVIPKTWYFPHLEENISLFDFSLSQEDMARIDALDRGKFLNYPPDYSFPWIPKKYHELMK